MPFARAQKSRHATHVATTHCGYFAAHGSNVGIGPKRGTRPQSLRCKKAPASGCRAG